MQSSLEPGSICTDWENSEELSLLDQYLIKMDELMFQNYF